MWGWWIPKSGEWLLLEGKDEMSSMGFNSAVIVWLFFNLKYTDASHGGRQGSPLQRSCLENPMDRGAWWATVHGVVKNWTQLKRRSTHAPILMCVHYSLCFSEYLEFSQFKKSITLKTILSEGSCHNMYRHDNKFNSQTCSSIWQQTGEILNSSDSVISSRIRIYHKVRSV